MKLRLAFTCIVFQLSAFSQQGGRPPEISFLLQPAYAADPAAVIKILAAHGAKVKLRIPQIGVSVISMAEPTAPGVIKMLRASGLFTFVENDAIARPAAIPNDPLFSQQWHLGTVNAIAAWDIGTGSPAAPIALIDSGVDPAHPDLASKLVPGWNFLTASSNTADNYGHGTATAGVAGAIGNNVVGVTGISWRNPIMPLLVVDSTGSASYSNVVNAITYAADHGVRVVNISLGGTSPSSALQSAVDYAWNKGVVIFASAMNASTSTPYYPAACNHVIAVSATEPGDSLAAFSNYGSWIDLAAPGDNILTTNNGGGYGAWAGTSFSSPIAAGVAALVLGVNPALSASALVALIENNSDDIGVAGFDTSFGWGRVNAYRASAAALSTLPSDTTPPSVSITAPSIGSTVSGTVQIAGTAVDNIGVVRVELWADGQFISPCSLSFACAWSTSSTIAGSHTLVVKAYDSANNAGSATLSVTVATSAPTADSVAPSVQLQNPLNNTTLATPNVIISGTATDNVGVTQVSVFIDEVLGASFSGGAFSYQWNAKKSGSGLHTITVRAWDAAGNIGLASVSVRVR